MLRGIHEINIDVKGRMGIPTKYRDTLTKIEGSHLVGTIDPKDPCLLIYPYAEWVEIEKKISQLPTFDAASRRIQRLIIGHATEMELDGQGRVLLSPALREYAKLDKKVVLVGQGRKFELWSLESWQRARDTWLDGAQGDDKLPEAFENIAL